MNVLDILWLVAFLVPVAIYWAIRLARMEIETDNYKERAERSEVTE